MDQQKTIGKAIKHYRKLKRDEKTGKSLTQGELAERVYVTKSLVSKWETGAVTPSVDQLKRIATVLEVPLANLLDGVQSDDPWVELTARYERASRESDYAEFQLKRVEIPPNLYKQEAVQQLIEENLKLYEQVKELKRAISGGEDFFERVDAAIDRVRSEEEKRNNYYAYIEHQAKDALRAVGGGDPGASLLTMVEIAKRRYGFEVIFTDKLPFSVRGATDLKHKRIYVSSRADARQQRHIIGQELGHYALNHSLEPKDLYERLVQRTESNYFAAALIMPENKLLEIIFQMRQSGGVDIQLLKDLFNTTYEMTLHRLTSMMTHHLAIPAHFLRCDSFSNVTKHYSVDRVPVPTQSLNPKKAKRVCQRWAATRVLQMGDHAKYYQLSEHSDGSGDRFFCVSWAIKSFSENLISLTIGVPAEHRTFFREGNQNRLQPVQVCRQCGGCNVEECEYKFKVDEPDQELPIRLQASKMGDPFWEFVVGSIKPEDKRYLNHMVNWE